jgi:sporulation protein YlmC with PRC-barrel domain
LDVSNLFDREVVGNNGSIIGRVRNLDLIEKTWQIESLVVELDDIVAKEFNMKKALRKTIVKILVTYVQAVGDKVILNADKQKLMELVASSHSTTESQ